MSRMGETRPTVKNEFRLAIKLGYPPGWRVVRWGHPIYNDKIVKDGGGGEHLRDSNLEVVEVEEWAEVEGQGNVVGGVKKEPEVAIAPAPAPAPTPTPTPTPELAPAPTPTPILSVPPPPPTTTTTNNEDQSESDSDSNLTLVPHLPPKTTAIHPITGKPLSLRSVKKTVKKSSSPFVFTSLDRIFDPNGLQYFNHTAAHKALWKDNPEEVGKKLVGTINYGGKKGSERIVFEGERVFIPSPLAS